MAYNKQMALHNNIRAIEIAFLLEKENRKATKNEIELLKKYSGFGGLKCVLFDARDEADKQRMPSTETDMFSLVQQLNTILRLNAETPIQYKEYIDSIRNSVQTAFYTPSFIPQAIATVFQNADISFPTVLDPSAGIGIFGQVMQNTWPQSHIDCFEKDMLTAKILAAINPDFRVKSTGFEKITPSKNNSYDLVTSNIPFGSFKVFDPSFRKSGNHAKAHSLQFIHDYFFLKGVDVLRPGGILAFITSKGVMDAPVNQIVRKSIISQCRLLSAVRFPDNLFTESSGIQVPSDLILLQKRLSDVPLSLSQQEEWFIQSHSGEGGISQNEFFHNTPNNILAEIIGIGTNQFGRPDYTYHTNQSLTSLEEKLSIILKKEIEQTFSITDYQTARKPSPPQTIQPTPSHQIRKSPAPTTGMLSLFDIWDNQELEEEALKQSYQPYTLAVPSLPWHENGMLAIDRDKVGIITNVGITPNFAPIEVSENHKTLLTDYLAIRNSYIVLYNTERDTEIEQPQLREAFNQAYDKFHRLHGALNEKKNQKILMKDPFQMAVQSTELYFNGEYIKGTLFSAPIKIDKPKELPTDLSPEHALLDSFNRFGTINLSYICQTTGLDSDSVIQALKGRICYYPLLKQWQPYEKFIACDVYSRYDECEKSLNTTNETEKSWIQDSMDLLMQARPKLRTFADIDLNMGERWVPLSYYERFAKHLFLTDVKINYFSGIDRFIIDRTGERTMQITTQWSVRGDNKNYNGLDLFRYALEDRYPDVTRTIFDEKLQKNKQVIDATQTQIMAGKVTDIREQFVEWMQKIPLEDKQSLMERYNRLFNCYARPKYDGSHLTFPGFCLENFEGIKSLYSSQKDAVWMGIMNFGGNIDHSVGGGKTLVMCLLSHELVRLGLAKKPVITGLKSNINAIAETYAKAYPQDNMLFVRSEDMTTKKRIELFHKIKNNSWDVIIMSHENFGKIKQSDSIQIEMMEKAIDELISTKLLGKDLLSKMDMKFLEKAIENKKVQLQDFLYDINKNKTSGTAMPDFEEMGIGHILVDESHNYKNLGYGATKHSRVSGLGDAKGSQKAQNMLLSIRTIQKQTHQDLGASFFSGTTISNSLVELYSNFVYLRPNALKKQGITCFDAWLSNYAQKTSEFEINVTNEIVNKERFRYFVKVDVLAMFYAQITDFRIADDIGLQRPLMKEELRLCKLTPEQANFAEVLRRFAKDANFEEVGPYVNSTNEKAKMLIATDLERKMALDMRILDSERFEDHPDNKISQCAADVATTYYQYNELRGTQFIFTDLGAYRGDGTFTPVEALKEKLVNQYGIPEHEIRFIQEFNTDKKKEYFTKQMNAGNIRVAIGGTINMGTGINAQERCVAINHLDIPWRPADLEQRNGRGCRPGNLIVRDFCNNILPVRYYCTEKSLDAYKYNLLKFKQGFIYQFKSCSMDTHKMDEGSLDEKTGMNYSEYCAILSGNTDLLDKIKLDKTISRLESSRKAFYNELDFSNYNYRTIESKLKSDKNILDRISQDECAITPEMQERLKIFQYFDTAPANTRTTTLVRVKEYNGVSSSEKVGELIKMKIDYLMHLGQPDRQEEVAKFGNFIACVSTIKDITGGISILLSVHGPGNIFYKHNYGSVPIDKTLIALSFERALLTIPRIKSEYIEKVAKNAKQLDQLAIIVKQTWGKEDNLAELKAQRVELEKKIASAISNEESTIDEKNEIQQMNEEEIIQWENKVRAQADLKLIGIPNDDILRILEGEDVVHYDLELTNPYNEEEKVYCQYAKFSFDSEELHINNKSVKEYFTTTMNHDISHSSGYKR